MQYYFQGAFSEFEEYLESLPHENRHFDKYEELKPLGARFGEMFYIKRGTLTSSFYHESGRARSSGFYGPGYLVPLYAPDEWENMRALSFHAVTEMDVLVFDRKKFINYLNTNPDLNEAMYRAYMKLVVSLMSENSNMAFNTGMERLANFLCAYMQGFPRKSNTIHLSQNEVMEYVALSRANLARYLKTLREEGIIETYRNKIVIRDQQALQSYCSEDFFV